ncbi:MAG: DNA recombination protein RmuC [Peptococcaceae bacterium]|nr:DNA recombination protein RmuC [Peptococcaceae bacterium]
MPSVIVSLLFLAALLFIWYFLKRRADELPRRVDAAVKEQLASFQEGLRTQLECTRSEVERSKDLIAGNAVATLRTINQLGETVRKMVQQQEEAQKLGQSLKDILQAPRLRGAYGEVILEEMLERILPRGIWQRQYAVNGREKVDAAVILKDTVVPIDAKFPRDAYRRYLEAGDDGERSLCWKEYEGALRVQINSIRTKYIRPDLGTTEFALMFIPSEAIYYETIAMENHLGEPSAIFEFAQASGVIPVSPNTFYAFLQVVVLGVRNLEMVKKARELQKGLSGLERSFNSFYKKYEEMGRSLERAAESYRVGNTHVTRYKRFLDDILRMEIAGEENLELED